MKRVETSAARDRRVGKAVAGGSGTLLGVAGEAESAAGVGDGKHLGQVGFVMRVVATGALDPAAEQELGDRRRGRRVLEAAVQGGYWAVL